MTQSVEHKRIKILFLIHDLGKGGAEKVLVNLVNNLNKNKFEVHVMSLFAGGANEKYLSKDVIYHTIFKKTFPGNSKIMKLLTPKQLHRLFIKEKYDIEVSYLEGPSARIISGCDNSSTKLVSWIHSEQKTLKDMAASFRNEAEMKKCYNDFHQTICVSEYIKNHFCNVLDFQKPCAVLYNVIETDIIKQRALEAVPEFEGSNEIRLISVGTLKEVKGFDRLIRVFKRLSEDRNDLHLYILGEGPLWQKLTDCINQNNLQKKVTLLGYKDNPYKYVKNSHLFVCSSYSEGFSTAVTEALIVGTPVCTTNVSGMNEMLGKKSIYGVLTENSEEHLYQGIRSLLLSSNELQKYKNKAAERGSFFNKDNTTLATENMLLSLLNEQ